MTQRRGFSKSTVNLLVSYTLNSMKKSPPYLDHMSEFKYAMSLNHVAMVIYDLWTGNTF